MITDWCLYYIAVGDVTTGAIFSDWSVFFYSPYGSYTLVPSNSTWEYAFYLSIILIMIGMMGEFYTRKQASASWNARR